MPTSTSRDNMLAALKAFHKAHGHCNVPALFKANRSLGRWVAARRYKRKIGELSRTEITGLDRLGFVWCATDLKWNVMFDRLLAFKKGHGHCDVPSVYAADPKLATWISRQRHLKKKGKQTQDRTRRLDEIGFRWTGNGKAESQQEPGTGAVAAESRLYHLGAAGYVQYDGKGPMPAELKRYLAQHNDEMPGFIPLPSSPVEFSMGNGRKVAWAGRGPIPAVVLEYVNENGSLPVY